MRYVEDTIPVLTNKAFRHLSKITNQVRIFRTATLLSVLAEWFPSVLSRENAVRTRPLFIALSWFVTFDVFTIGN